MARFLRADKSSLLHLHSTIPSHDKFPCEEVPSQNPTDAPYQHSSTSQTRRDVLGYVQQWAQTPRFIKAFSTTVCIWIGEKYGYSQIKHAPQNLSLPQVQFQSLGSQGSRPSNRLSRRPMIHHTPLTVAFVHRQAVIQRGCNCGYNSQETLRGTQGTKLTIKPNRPYQAGVKGCQRDGSQII